MNISCCNHFQVTLDLCKMSYAYFVHHDRQLYDEEDAVAANANNSSIGEELGQVDGNRSSCGVV